MEYVLLLGRILFSSIFILGSIGHFLKGGIAYATEAGVPMAHVLTPLSGVLSLVGGLSILLGYKAKAGAWLLVIFLIPTTFIVHDFWEHIMEPHMAMMQRGMFFKNLSLIGGALIIAYFGSGPYSLNRK